MKNLVVPRASALRPGARRRAFTLIEILVVIGIIALLAALLFPAFSRARENARQNNCATNLQQIYFAVEQYHQDTRRYPDSLVDLLPDGAQTTDGITILKGTGYLKGGADVLLCPNDDVTDPPSSSYGALSKFPAAATPTDLATTPGKYVFNYWGYNPDGFVYDGQTAAATAGNATPALLVRGAGTTYDKTNNPIKFSLSNRFAPNQTIITHCVYHRPQTAADLALPNDLYTATGNGAGARDIVLRLDGAAKVVDVSAWKAQTKWQNQ